MEIIYADSYTKNGCKFYGKLGVIEYEKGGLCDQLGRAKALMREKHPKAVQKVGIPDVVFEVFD